MIQHPSLQGVTCVSIGLSKALENLLVILLEIPYPYPLVIQAPIVILELRKSLQEKPFSRISRRVRPTFPAPALDSISYLSTILASARLLARTPEIAIQRSCAAPSPFHRSDRPRISPAKFSRRAPTLPCPLRSRDVFDTRLIRPLAAATDDPLP